MLSHLKIGMSCHVTSIVCSCLEAGYEYYVHFVFRLEFWKRDRRILTTNLKTCEVRMRLFGEKYLVLDRNTINSRKSSISWSSSYLRFFSQEEWRGALQEQLQVGIDVNNSIINTTIFYCKRTLSSIKQPPERRSYSLRSIYWCAV